MNVDTSHKGVVFYWTHDGFRQLDTPSIEIKLPVTVSSYGASLGLHLKKPEMVINSIKEGLPVSAFEQLCANMDVNVSNMAGIVRIARRTLVRRKREGKLKPSESERVYRLSSLFDKAVQVLGTGDAASQWFKTPKKALGGKTPLEYSDTELGAREVEDLLGRLEHGVFS